MSDADKEPPSDGEHRRADRRRVLQTAMVVYPDLRISFRCAIRDRSAIGARLKLPEGILAPPRFWLIDAAEGVAHDATTIWRRDPEAGVSLADPIDLKEPGHDLLQRQLHALWLEISPRR